MGVPPGPNVPGGRSVAWTGANRARPAWGSGTTKKMGASVAAGVQRSSVKPRGIADSAGGGGHDCADAGGLASVATPATTATMQAR